jgi:hypothetical protein
VGYTKRKTTMTNTLFILFSYLLITLLKGPLGIVSYKSSQFALREHRFSRKWHYAIDMDESNQDSLASYLRMNHQQLRSLLLATGLARLHGQKFQILRNHFGWDNFCAEQSLEKGHYFDAMVVNNKRHYWIGVGLEPKKKKSVLDDARKVDIALNPGTQSTSFKTPPRLPKSNQALLRKNSSHLKRILHAFRHSCTQMCM